MKKVYFLVWMCLWGLTGCSDFLEEDSKENTYATSCSDLNELLVGSGYMEHQVAYNNTKFTIKTASGPYFPWLHVMDDDVEEVVLGNYTETNSRYKLNPFYTWEKDPFNEAGVLFNDPTWGRLYKHIAVTNVILDKVEEFTHDTEEDRNIIRGQSHFLRATYYYLLVNIYAKPYDPISAATDLGVPLKLTPYVGDIDYKRSPVDSVYHQIVRDLKQAIHYLDGYEPKTVRRATKSAAQLFLSRVYCYMGQWDSVPALCESVLAREKYQLKDLTVTKDTGWIDANSPEIIFSQGSHSTNFVFKGEYENSTDGISGYRISDELHQIFDENKDKRWMLSVDTIDVEGFTIYIPRKVRASMPSEEFSFVSDNFTFRLSEAYLNLAEALAMTGREGEARNVLEKLMKKRIVDLAPITESGESLIRLIRKERRREFCFEGQRWFDLRRYAVSSKFPETKSIKHVVYDYAYGDKSTPGVYRGYYQLPDYPDGGWVLPIPTQEIEQTEGSIVNNDRESCLFYE